MIKKSKELRAPIIFIEENLKKDLIGAEVGVKHGDHAIQMLEYLSIKHLYLIDIWSSWVLQEKNEKYNYKEVPKNDYERIIQRLKPYSNITFIREESVKAAQQFKDATFDFIYIDGNHNCDSVLADLYVWERKIKSGGVICGHDYKWYNVKDAIDIYLKLHPRNIQNSDSVRGDWWWVVP